MHILSTVQSLSSVQVPSGTHCPDEHTVCAAVHAVVMLHSGSHRLCGEHTVPDAHGRDPSHSGLHTLAGSHASPLGHIAEHGVTQVLVVGSQICAPEQFAFTVHCG